MDNNNSAIFTEIELSYRTYYGKLFSALLFQFGTQYVNQIEDAIQNSFYKSLKSWKPGQIPNNKENWLYIVARNNLINRIKKEKKLPDPFLLQQTEEEETLKEDLRLQTILLFTNSNNFSAQTKVLFILKNIFGLHVKEISECTLLSHDAIYKSINRAKKYFKSNFKNKPFSLTPNKVSDQEIAIIEEILYAVFNIGFDSFNKKIGSTINEDLCLESLALAKFLLKKFNKNSTKNLIALFCFHLARIPAKLNGNRLIPFFKQETNKWNNEFIELGFHYLEKPKTLNKYYIEALIASMHMTTADFDDKHWKEVIKLYELLIKITRSPIAKLNLCYCLNKAQRKDKAIKILETIEQQLPNEHFYFSLVKATILKENNSAESEKLISRALNKVNQPIRKNYISENMILNF